MARLREFDLDAAVKRAMAVFWRRGYAGTAMSDIYAATGLKPGSVYAAFGDKAGLFRLCFEAYAAEFRASLPARQRGLAAIEAWLATQVLRASEDPERRGCLIINTVMEHEVHSEATRALAQGRLQEIRDFFLSALAEALAAREIPADTPIVARADALTGAVVAMMALGRAGADRTAIAHVAQAALRL